MGKRVRTADTAPLTTNGSVISCRRGADFCTIGAVRNGVGMSDPLACTSFPRVSGVGPGMAGGQGEVVFILLVGSPDCSR